MKAVAMGLVLGMTLPAGCHAEEQFQNRIQGDLGGFINAAPSSIRGDHQQPRLLPYAYFDYGRAFVRLDTLGVKTLPVGYGHLELVGRVKFDGYQSAGNAALQGINARQNSIPLGVGSLQLTPYGALFVYAFHDANQSQGRMYEAVYAAKFVRGAMALYPQLGVEHYSSSYTRYYYGVTGSEAAASGYAAYSPGAASNPLLKLLLEVRLAEGWYANFYLRRKWLGDPIARSPLVERQHEDNGFAGVAYRFE